MRSLRTWDMAGKGVRQKILDAISICVGLTEEQLYNNNNWLGNLEPANEQKLDT